MTQADEKKSSPDILQPRNSRFTEMGLPDVQFKTESAAGDKPPSFPIVGVGASAGGVEALQRLFKSLAPDRGIAYVAVVHLAPAYPSHLADILAKSTSMPVVQVSADVAVKPDTVYVIPPNYFLTLDGGFLHIHQIPQPRPLPRAIDRFFISLAEEQQERAICIVLTGADHDGTIGLKAIKAAGGMVMAQLPETAQHPGMPASAIHTGLVDYILPIEDMGERLFQYIDQSALWQSELPAIPVEETGALGEIVALLGTRGGGDFRGYKEGMLMRRTKRRMALQGLTSLEAYAAHLRENPDEVRALGADFLINVTEFFREAQAWEALEQQVLPEIIETLAPGETLRVWVAGCATGEEAYSMAITLLELISKGGVHVTLNIIGSDLDHSSLEVARAGIYPESIAAVLKPELLARYFIREDGGQFRARKVLRESIMFSQHNLLSDPPFSHMSLVSCRNLLIYMKPDVQDKLIQMFHFALKPGGYLFLGKSETIGEHNELFTPVDKPYRIYRCLPTERKIPVKLPLVADTSTTRLGSNPTAGQSPRVAYAEMVRELLLRQRSATAVLIDRDLQVLYFYGPTRDFMWQPEGATTRDLLAMVSDEMRIALRAVIHSVVKEGKSGEIILPAPTGENRQLRVRAVKAGEENGGGLVLVTFEYEALSNGPNQAVADAESWAKRQLEDDLRTTRLDLQSSIQALEASNVELRIANEEAMSMNEELQSANEELETSKEEMQSVNEELNTVNSDLERTVNELRTANDDLSNLLASSDLPTLFLDRDLRIKRFTPASCKLFSLIPSDIGRPISDFASRLEPQDLKTVADQVQSSRTVAEHEVHTPQGNFYLRRVLPYRVEEDHVEGVVITFVPIDALKRAEQEVRESEKRFRTLADTAPVFIWISGLDAKLEFVNRRFADETGGANKDLLGVGWHSLVHSGDLAAYLTACSNAEAACRGYDCELRLRKANGSYSWMRFVGEPRFDREKLVGFVGSSVDIQYHKNAEEQLRDADRRKDEFLAILGHELRNPLSPIRNAAQALKFVDSDDKRLLWARETIIRQVDHMTRLVDDLLDIARLTRGTLTLRKETVDMAVIVHHAVESTKELVDTRKHHLKVVIKDEPLFVEGDPVRLTQIVENLLTNAAKFTEEGGNISLEVRREGNELVMSVRDNGIGIPQRMLSKIFELFMQEERAIRKSSSGLGIGLSLVFQLVSLHGGKIRATSKGAGQGSEFILRLPVVDVETPPVPVAGAAPESGTARILIVDDNIDSADSMAMLMSAYGHQVRAAYDFESAIREAASFVPHVALLDLSKPEPDGMELARQFHQMDETKKTMLIAYSGYGQPDDLERTRQAGFAHHLVKPTDPESIHKLINSMKLNDS
jgi:two-component system CheB/CheR fusion protein